MEKMIAENKFVEHANVCINRTAGARFLLTTSPCSGPRKLVRFIDHECPGGAEAAEDLPSGNRCPGRQAGLRIPHSGSLLVHRPSTPTNVTVGHRQPYTCLACLLTAAFLSERLIKRGSENDESIALRLKNAKSEMEFGKAAGFFEHHLVNDDLDTAFRELVSVVTSWYPHLETQATA